MFSFPAHDGNSGSLSALEALVEKQSVDLDVSDFAATTDVDRQMHL